MQLPLVRTYSIKRQAKDQEAIGIVVECPLMRGTNSFTENAGITSTLHRLINDVNCKMHILFVSSLKDNRFAGEASDFTTMLKNVYGILKDSDKTNISQKYLILTDAKNPSVRHTAKEKTNLYCDELEKRLNIDDSVQYSCQRDPESPNNPKELREWKFHKPLKTEDLKELFKLPDDICLNYLSPLSTETNSTDWDMCNDLDVVIVEIQTSLPEQDDEKTN